LYRAAKHRVEVPDDADVTLIGRDLEKGR